MQKGLAYYAKKHIKKRQIIFFIFEKREEENSPQN
jgi:hypothetical protein